MVSSFTHSHLQSQNFPVFAQSLVVTELLAVPWDSSEGSSLPAVVQVFVAEGSFSFAVVGDSSVVVPFEVVDSSVVSPSAVVEAFAVVEVVYWEYRHFVPSVHICW